MEDAYRLRPAVFHIDNPPTCHSFAPTRIENIGFYCRTEREKITFFQKCGEKQLQRSNLYLIFRAYGLFVVASRDAVKTVR